MIVLTISRIIACLKAALPKALKTAWWMIRIMLPVSLGVMLMQYFGLLIYISKYLTPAFHYIGLPGESALVFITSGLLSIYAAIAVIGTLALDMREITILAIMCLITHNMIFETAVQKKTGSSALRMVMLRLIMSFFAAAIFNFFLPSQMGAGLASHTNIQNLKIINLLEVWLRDSVWLSFKVILIVTSLMFVQQVLEEFGIMEVLSKAFRPFMKPMGLSERTSFQWIIANTVGLAYGSAIMIEQVESGNLPIEDADLLNHHIAISHSLLEDTLLFVAIGVSAPWIIFPRIVFAIVSVWEYKFEKRIRKI
jgi:hypothetical protein